jgi:hypothetical protein
VFESREKHQFNLEFALADDHVGRRNKLREKLAELRSIAIAELERRGYEVCRKTPGGIRQLLKQPASKRKSKTKVRK